MTGKIARWVARDVLRSIWLGLYTFFFLIITLSFFTFFDDPSRVLLSLLNLVLMVVPLVSMIFVLTYLHNNRNFIVLTLTQPVSRRSVFWGYWWGLAIPLQLALLVGMGLPVAFHLLAHRALWLASVLQVVGAMLLTQIFLGLAIWLSFAHEDRLKALASGLLVWLSLTFLYDGLLLVVILLASAYPIEKFAVGLSFLNPLDLVRLLLLMQMDVAALMGFTAEVFKKFLGNAVGTLAAVTALLIWIAFPTWMAFRNFMKKDF